MKLMSHYDLPLNNADKSDSLVSSNCESPKVKKNTVEDKLTAR